MNPVIPRGLMPSERQELLDQAKADKRSLEQRSNHRKIATRTVSCLCAPVSCPVITCISSLRSIYQICHGQPIDNPNSDNSYCNQLLDCSIQRPPNNLTENCQLALSPFPCCCTALDVFKICDPCIGKPEDQDRLLNDFYLRPPERQQMEEISQKITNLQKQREEIDNSLFINPQRELDKIAKRKKELLELQKTRKKVACCTSCLCLPVTALFSPFCIEGDNGQPDEHALPNQSCFTNCYSKNASCHPRSRAKFWALAVTPIPCFGQMANRCETNMLPESARQTKIYDSRFFFFPPERQEMESLENREKQIQESRELQMQPFFDATESNRGIASLVFGYSEEEHK